MLGLVLAVMVACSPVHHSKHHSNFDAKAFWAEQDAVGSAG